MSALWTGVPNYETPIVSTAPTLPSLDDMSSTLLTKRRAVDHCRVRSALCRMR
jgi:hypothetical protein